MGFLGSARVPEFAMNRLIFAQAISAILQLALALVVPRIYAADEIGVAATIASTAAILGSVLSLRFEVFLPHARTESEKRDVVLISISLSVMVSVLILFLAAGYSLLFSVPESFAVDSPVSFILFAQLMALAISINSILYYLNISNSDYVGLSGGKMIMAGSNLCFSTAFSGFGFSGLVVAQLLAYFGQMIFAARRYYRVAFYDLNVRWVELKATFAVAKRYAIPDMGATALSSLSQHGPLLVIGLVFGAGNAGMFYVLSRLFGFPSFLIGTALSEWYLSILKTRRDGLMNVQKPIEQMYSVALYAAMCLVLFVVISGEKIISLIFGAQYADKAAFIFATLIVAVGAIVAGPVAHIYAAKGFPERGFAAQFKLNLIRAFGLTAAVFIEDVNTALFVIAASSLAAYSVFVASCLIECHGSYSKLGSQSWDSLFQAIIHVSPAAIFAYGFPKFWFVGVVVAATVVGFRFWSLLTGLRQFESR